MNEDYKGMSHDAEEAYNQRQNEPLFKSSKDMIPMEHVKEIINNRKCYNHKKGCKFQTKWYFCTCCMMLKAVGQDFFDYEGKLQKEDTQFAFSMTDWQRDMYDDSHRYWAHWCMNFPRGASD
jgi:late competence protein required for DNA uptake (superfamily II DNA/RNA helicase)